MSQDFKKIESLELTNASLTVGGGVEILQNVSLDIPTGQVVWIRGLSGSGKSTFLKMLAGLIMPQVGEYKVNGENVARFSFEEFLPIRCRIGYSFDFGGLLNNRTISQNLTLPLMYHNSLSADEAAHELREVFKDFQLEPYSEMRPSNVVGGVRKATCVARAFVMNPEVLLLDDPTTGLRNEVKVSLKKNILQRMAAGALKHVFVVSDDMNFIGDIFSHVISIEDKKLTSYSGHEWKVKNAS